MSRFRSRSPCYCPAGSRQRRTVALLVGPFMHHPRFLISMCAAGVPTLNSLLAAVQSLSEALTGLERVLLTPSKYGVLFYLEGKPCLHIGTLNSTCRMCAIPSASLQRRF